MGERREFDSAYKHDAYQGGGHEHDVSHGAAAGHWLKFTKPERAGYAVELFAGRLQMLPATPLQYLRRWRFANQLFADDVELIGLAIDGSQTRIVISQRNLRGEAPNWEELHLAMTEVYGLHRLKTNVSVGAYEPEAYAGNRFAIFDVRPANCVRTAEGDAVPFDAIPQAFSRADAAVLRNLCERA